MGLCCSDNKNTTIINPVINVDEELNELNICTFNTRLFQSINYSEKIDNLINFITTSDCNVICLQGINDVKLLRIIIKKLFKHNLNDNLNKLTTYPMIESFYLNTEYSGELLVNDTASAEVMKITWSNSDGDNMAEIDSLIITKENIISGSKLPLKSFELNSKVTNVYIANIEWNNTIISIYNTSFQSDFVGISHEQQRKIQIKELRDIVLENYKNVMTCEDYVEYNKKGINIICCQSSIRELLNNTINPEYLYFTRTLNSLDTYRYVQTLKGITINSDYDSTDISGARSSYILLAGLNTHNFENIELIGKELFNTHNLIIVNAKIKKFKLYEDFIVSTTFLSKHLNKQETISKENKLEDIAIEII